VRTVQVRLQHADLSREMATMREWLDHSGYAPRRFNCDQDGDAVILSVDFMVAAQADAFGLRFDRRSGLPPSGLGQSIRPRNKPRRQLIG
jgi:hypothetical protein